MTKGKANGKAKASVRDHGRSGRKGGALPDDGAGAGKPVRGRGKAGATKAAQGRAKLGDPVKKPGGRKGGTGRSAPAAVEREPSGRQAGPKQTRAQAIADVKRAQEDLKKAGRPTKLTVERMDTILAGLRAGKFLPQIIDEARKADPDFPADRTIHDWAETDPDISAAIARARAYGAERFLGDVPEIVDDGRNDFVLARGGYVVDQEALGRSKLRAEYRLKLAALMAPKQFGAKVELASNPERPFGGNKRPLTDYTEAELIEAFEASEKARGERDGD